LDLIVNSKFPDMRRCLNELEVFWALVLNA